MGVVTGYVKCLGFVAMAVWVIGGMVFGTDLRLHCFFLILQDEQTCLAEHGHFLIFVYAGGSSTVSGSSDNGAFSFGPASSC